MEVERGRLFLWAPVGMAAGAGAYLSLPFEPSAASVALLCAAAAALFVLAMRTRLFVPLALIACTAAGIGVAKLRVELLHNPVVAQRSGLVEVRGWVESVTDLASGVRVVLRVRAIEGWSEDRLPRNLRLNIYGGDVNVQAGQAVSVRTRLEPVPGPVEPGGFDFGRRAWFLGIGGVGEAFAAVADSQAGSAPLDIRARAWADGLRLAISQRIAQAVEGARGGLLIAVTTGRRGDLDAQAMDDLRAAGLAHLLAISGLHMALIAGTAFWTVRALLAMHGGLALRFAIKKWAAVAAFGVAAGYLVLSGMSVSTQRAFIMVGIMFLAILVDRPAISIRNVAVAAMIVLVFRPESAVDVSFQMSFMTVTVLVAFFEWRMGRKDREGRRTATRGVWGRAWRSGMVYGGGVCITTMLAGIATGPISAYHFNTVAAYGVLANLVAVPLMGVSVMPLALFAVFAMPLGLEPWFLQPAAVFVSVILDTADWVASLPGAVRTVATPPPAAALAMVGGMLVLSLVQARWRLAGFALIAAGLLAGGSAQRPIVLVERDGKVAAIRNADGALVLTSSRAGRFAAGRWLGADGDAETPSAAAMRPGLACDQHACVGRTGSGVEVAWLRGSGALWDECREAAIVVASFPIGAGCAGPRVVIDWWDIYGGGAHAVYEIDGELVVRTANGSRGTRPWVPQRDRERADGDDSANGPSDDE